MSELLLQVLILVAFGGLTAVIVTRNQWRDEMIKRGVASYNWQTANGTGVKNRGCRKCDDPSAVDRGKYRQAARFASKGHYFLRIFYHFFRL
jgi:hypothetical protein